MTAQLQEDVCNVAVIFSFEGGASCVCFFFGFFFHLKMSRQHPLLAESNEQGILSQADSILFG